jgi:recombination protein RecA
MAKPFDVSKFRKTITKSIDGISIGFRDPDTWVSTGNYALNYLISGQFDRGVPIGKVTVFAGESGAGKSFICSGNLIRNAQEQGIYVILVDTENALDEKWLHALNVDTSEEKLLKLNLAMIDDVAKLVTDFVKEYKTLPEDDRPKVLFVLDSLGMMLTPTDVNQFEAGDLKGDMGRKPKALTALVRNCVNMFGDLNIGLVATNHTYASQDMFDPDDKISGGQGFIYASSIVVAMRKLKLKEDDEGNKVSEVKGIRAACKIMKTRYAKPFESVQVKIPYETGMNPYSGLVDLFESKGLLEKEGNRLKYVLANGTEIKQFRKAWEKNEEGCLDQVMADVVKNPHKDRGQAISLEEEITNDD